MIVRNKITVIIIISCLGCSQLFAAVSASLDSQPGQAAANNFASVVQAATRAAAEQVPHSTPAAPTIGGQTETGTGPRKILWPRAAAVRGPGSRIPRAGGRQRQTSETSRLEGLDTVFTDFCVFARDYVFDHLRVAAMDHLTGTAMKVLESISRSKEGKSRGFDEHYDDDDDSDSSNSSKNVKSNNNNNKKGGGGITLPGMLFDWAKNTFSFVVNIMQIQNSLSAEGFTEHINHACNFIADYDASLEQEFVAEKSYQVQQHQTDELMLDYLRAVKMHSLPCGTLENLARLHSFCQVFKNSRGSLEKAMSIGRGNNRQQPSRSRSWNVRGSERAYPDLGRSHSYGPDRSHSNSNFNSPQHDNYSNTNNGYHNQDEYNNFQEPVPPISLGPNAYGGSSQESISHSRTSSSESSGDYFGGVALEAQPEEPQSPRSRM